MLVNCLSSGRAKYCNVCYRYSMLHRVIDSREVSAQKAAPSTQSSGSSSVYHLPGDELKMIRLKEAMRQ
jgi:hypothetical protein